MPGKTAYFNFTFVFGMKMYRAVNIPQVRTKGVRRTKNFIIGANKANSWIFFTKVDMKMEMPLESRISNGSSKSMEK